MKNCSWKMRESINDRKSGTIMPEGKKKTRKYIVQPHTRTHKRRQLFSEDDKMLSETNR